MSIIPTDRQTALVEVLTAEVRTVVVSNRQVTLSVYKQLDTVPVSDMDPWGRVRTGRPTDESTVELIGRSLVDGSLVASTIDSPGAFVPIGVSSDFGSVATFFGTRYGGRCTVLKEDGYTAFVWVESNPDALRTAPSTPITVIYDSKADEARVLAFARTRIAQAREMQALAAQMEELPLIVLAGLR